MSVPIRGEAARHGTHPSVICLEFATNNSICEIKQPVNRSLSVIIGKSCKKERKRERSQLRIPCGGAREEVEDASR